MISRPFFWIVTALALLASSAVNLRATDRYRSEKIVTAESVSLVVLHDEIGGLEIALAPDRGGELSSLRIRFQGQWLELIHHARHYGEIKGWRGKAPFLWPATGRNFAPGSEADKSGSACSYEWAGRTYPIPIHGFANSKAWQLLRVIHDEAFAQAEVELRDDASTREQYPFGFTVHIAYRLAEGKLELRHTVTAAADNTQPMPFSIGNHITFIVPFASNSAVADFTIESPSGYEILKNPDSLPSGQTRPLSFTSRVPLVGIKTNPALSLGGYAGHPWMTLRDPSGLGLRLSHSASSLPENPFVQFNLWGDPAAGFICPEPWVGLQNSLNSKRGLIQLPPGESWTWTIRIEPEIAAAASAGK